MRFLDSRRLDNDLIELPMFACVAATFFDLPRLQNKGQGFLEDPVGIHHVDTEGVKFVVAIHLPTPKSRRPSETRANVACCSANKTGLCQGRVITAVTRRYVVVFAVRYVIGLNDAET